MNKNEFLMRLRKALASLPFEECQSAMKYYEEYFAEAGEDREAEILKELGSPEMLAATILGEYSSAPAHTYDVRNSSSTAGYADASYRYSSASGYGEDREPPQEPWYRRTPLWVLILLGIVLCPIIFPAIGVAFGVLCTIFGLIIAAIAIMASLGIAGLALGVGGVIMVLVGAVRVVLNPAGGIITIGAGLVLAGIGVLIMLAGIWLFSNFVPSVFRSVVAFLRRIFNRGGASL